mmetsp:Transcript_13149/g.24715  ORF Transcript_13149/g.24715 Transcript_13149/m.24715 type:complete len:339 (-) Transcript_13149:145-1161(-)|eukprot:CAMPEP_0176497844 /NCGR_PEP_ID=MMETSP0200_2-20121128/11966_1 /TAXON_ID=947934 /ORGANISM="Chaetoceros sp., Strain GSL56" /LENGTH=338 /DNA_ID=CAMNT_0017895935 /DNA_START=55 /DNA_END=1071 /DNA_ORIENTATION=+
MPHVELPQAEFKVVMLGDTNVGKTSLVLRFAEGYYRENSRSPTVGAFFITKRLLTESGITCKVQIWDTAGQAQFRKMAPMYYKTAAAAILCYDVCNARSFECVKEWIEELSSFIQAGSIVIAIAATKYDLIDEPTIEKSSLVPTSYAKELANSIDAIFIDTSARNDENVNLLFQKVAERVLLVREQAKNRGMDVVGGGGVGMMKMDHTIPVTPGASMNEHGNVVKGNASRQETRISSVNQTNLTTDSSGGSTTMSNISSPTVGLTTNQHPIHSLRNDSPERTLEKGGKGQTNGVRGGDFPLKEEVAGEEMNRSSSVGLCMGPLMECSSSRDDGSCTIC